MAAVNRTVTELIMPMKNVPVLDRRKPHTQPVKTYRIGEGQYALRWKCGKTEPRR